MIETKWNGLVELRSFRSIKLSNLTIRPLNDISHVNVRDQIIIKIQFH